MNHICPQLKRKQIQRIVQNFYSFKRFTESVLNKSLTNKELLELIESSKNIPDEGLPLRDISRWIIGNRIISALRETIKQHGPIVAENMNSAAKRIVGKILE